MNTGGAGAVIIGISGKKKSGKNTTAEILRDILRLKVRIGGIADKLKSVLSEVFDLPNYKTWSRSFKEDELEEPLILTSNRLHSIIRAFKRNINNMTTYEIITQYENRRFTTIRELMQVVGTDILQNVASADVHLKQSGLKMMTGIVIVPDIRFIEEFNYFNDGERTFLPIYIDKLSKEVDEHRSETEMDQLRNRCTIINNSGTIQDLTSQLVLYCFNNKLKLK